ncbi:MAG: ribonuclease HII [Actinobacteria bacterium]|nr:ribonuclease HII [Actinomycetota bacterium]
MAVVVRSGGGLYTYERALARAGLTPVAGADEAGRGACAGPLVAAATILSERKSRQIAGLRDSKLLTERTREELYEEILAKAVAVAWVEVSPEECDALGMHVADISALRRAVLRLSTPPAFVITDGFPVDGLGVGGVGMWKGDQVAACVAAASIVAKVTRDRIMTAYENDYPGYDFAVHKGYCTPLHQSHLERLGPCDIHRMRWDNVRRATRVVQP